MNTEMKKILLGIYSFAVLLVDPALAQTFKPQWVILENKPDIELIRSTDNAKFGSFETVLAFDKTDFGLLALDPAGRTINVLSDNFPAKYSSNGFSGPCLVKENILLKDGTTIHQNLFLWCYEINPETETAKIQTGQEKFITVPLRKIQLIRTLLSDKDASGEIVVQAPTEMPEFYGSINEWIAKHLRYPSSAKKHNKEGRVVVKFLVDEKGNVLNPKVTEGVGYGLDNEALRVVSAMPRWKPGTLNGKPVKVYFSMPITFRLE